MPASVTVMLMLRSVVSGMFDPFANVIAPSAVMKWAAVSPVALLSMTVPGVLDGGVLRLW